MSNREFKYISWSAGIGSAFLILLRVTEPYRHRALWDLNPVGLIGPILILLVYFVLAAFALLALFKNLRTRPVKAFLPVILLAVGPLFLKMTPDWELNYWMNRFPAVAAEYGRVAEIIKTHASITDSLYPLGAFAVPSAHAAASLPKVSDHLAIGGRALLNDPGTDSLAILFTTSATWTDNWMGYIYQPAHFDTAAYFGGHYYRVRRLSSRWWFVAST